MSSDTLESLSVREDLQVLLDGYPIALPQGSRSLPAIRSHLEMLALQQQRVLCSFSVDGADPARPSGARSQSNSTISRIEAQTFDLDELPARLLDMAIQQAQHAQEDDDIGKEPADGGDEDQIFLAIDGGLEPG